MVIHGVVVLNGIAVGVCRDRRRTTQEITPATTKTAIPPINTRRVLLLLVEEEGLEGLLDHEAAVGGTRTHDRTSSLPHPFPCSGQWNVSLSVRRTVAVPLVLSMVRE